MDSEDEAMPYLKLLNENSGNYLLQNSYELQDCLSVEPMFTEIETGTWPSECFPVLLNGTFTPVNENGNMKCVADQFTTEDDQESSEDIGSHIIFSQSVDSPETGICQKDDVSNLPDTAQNVLFMPQDPELRINARNFIQSEESHQGRQKRTLLLLANRNTYELSFSNKSINRIEQHDIHVKSNLLEDLRQCSEVNEVEDQEKTVSTYEYSKGQENEDLYDWSEFYSTVTVMKCKVCSFLCESSIAMNDHLKRLHSDLLYLKQVAEKKDSNGKQKVKMKSLLDFYSSSEHNMTIFVCSMCNKIFSTKESLMEHVKIHNQKPDFTGERNKNSNEMTKAQNEKPKETMRKLSTSLLKKQRNATIKVKCSVCKLLFPNNESKLRHEACHVPDTKQFQCSECKETFSAWGMCNKHLWTCHKIDAGVHSCPICNSFKSFSPGMVLNHMDTHNTEKPFICTVCTKGFKQLNQLRNHRLIHKTEEELPPWSKSRKCTICERSFANNRSLKIHIQSVHEKIKPFRCNICGHKTARKAMLELHIRQHTGDKPHHCPHCNYRTGDNNCLRKHVMKHFGFTKYSCPHCKYQAIQSSAYKNHLLTRHPDTKEIYKCGYCTFTSLRHGSYLTHVKCHEYNETKRKGKLADSSRTDVLTTATENGNQKEETQICLHLPEVDGYSENVEDEECLSISAGCGIKLAQ